MTYLCARGITYSHERGITLSHVTWHTGLDRMLKSTVALREVDCVYLYTIYIQFLYTCIQFICNLFWMCILIVALREVECVCVYKYTYVYNLYIYLYIRTLNLTVALRKVKFLKSWLLARFTMRTEYRADFWECVYLYKHAYTYNLYIWKHSHVEINGGSSRGRISQ